MSTETALHQIVSKIENTLENNQIAIVIFQDISRAFSEASIQGMLKALEKRKINRQLRDWIDYMLENREVMAHIIHGKVSKCAGNLGKSNLRDTILGDNLSDLGDNLSYLRDNLSVLGDNCQIW